MPSHTSLIDFSQSITLYKLTDPVKSLFDLARANPQQTILVIDREEKALGAIDTRYLQAYLKGQAGVKKLDRAGGISSLITPIVTLLVTTSLRECEAYLTAEVNRQTSEPIVILMDHQGKYLARLNTWRLMQFLLSQLRQTPTPPCIPPLKPLLINLLDQIPLPLLLYTEGEYIIHKNPQWQELIGEGIPKREYVARPLISSYNQVAELQIVETDIGESLSNLLVHPQAFREQPGQDKIWQLFTVPLKLAGETFDPPYWLVLATDVTQHQQCCQELAIKNADLIHLNRLKDEFLSCISHELKSPLTAIVGLSNLLKEKQIGELNPRQNHYADLIYRSGRQLMNLVNDLLDLTRLESGQLKLTTTRVSLSEVCQRAYRVIKDKYPLRLETEIRFCLKTEPNLQYVIADELRLQQMLVHLLDNAIKFTPEGGQVGIKISSWENWLGITVWDTGIGIPEDSQHLIFQKFQQLESPLTRQFEGTGLGLVLTQRLAKAHGGDISFISKSGRGSEFTLLLPAYPVLEFAGVNTNAGSKRKLALIVDSLPKQIEILKDHLEQMGYKSVVARTGTEAIEKARQLKPDYLFLNPCLPLLSGWDVLTLLKSEPSTASIRVIMIADAEAKQRAQENQCDGFLSMPVTLNSLASLLSGEPVSLAVSKSLKPPTILRLYDTEQPDSLASSWVWWTQLSHMNYRLLEADSLEQAEMLASVWVVNLILIDRTIALDLEQFFHNLQKSPYLSSIPLITLDPQITQAANRCPKLTVFPCLIPPGDQQIEQLLQVIHIALETQDINSHNEQSG